MAKNTGGLPPNRVGGKPSTGKQPAVSQSSYGSDVNQANPVGGGKK